LPEVARAQPEADQRYHLRASVDLEERLVHGRGRIHFRNHSRAPLHELWFHLYANAFAHERTVFLREGGATLRGKRLGVRGGIQVQSLRIDEGADVVAAAETRLLEDDQTQMRVPLAVPLPPGGSLEVEMQFLVRLPEIVARMGQSGSFAMLAQWFPKLAKLEPDGTFASFPYHGLGEFYADFADYDLEIEVREHVTVAAPGRLVEQEVRAGVRRERYVIGPALDVAFAVDPRLRSVSVEFGRNRVDVFAPRGHLRFARAQGRLAATTLVVLSERLGVYPYERLVLVLPPSEGHGASGMEYPGLIVGDALPFHTELSPVARIRHEVITTHELAHQWFPVLVASNELAHPVLDEGLAQWLGLDLVRARYGRDSIAGRLLGAPADAFDLLRASFFARREVPSSLLAANRYRRSELSHAVYLRPALVLEAVARTWGRPRAYAALGRYARENRFEHPGPSRLAAAFDAAYWPGFFAAVVEPALSGTRDRVPGVVPGRDLLDENLAPSVRPRRTHPWFGRLLYWAQALLTGFGP
jgi:hypothetical protein